MYSITVFKHFNYENNLDKFLSKLENFDFISCKHVHDDYSELILQICFSDENELERLIIDIDKSQRFRIKSRISRYQMLVSFRIYGPIFGTNNLFRGSIILQRFNLKKNGISIEFLTPRTGVIYFREVLAENGYRIIRQGNLQPIGTKIIDKNKDFEILNRAFEMGHFDFPKSCSVKELASSIGLSTTAVRKRMNRALRSVLSEQFDQEIKDLFS